MEETHLQIFITILIFWMCNAVASRTASKYEQVASEHQNDKKTRSEPLNEATRPNPEPIVFEYDAREEVKKAKKKEIPDNEFTLIETSDDCPKGYYHKIAIWHNGKNVYSYSFPTKTVASEQVKRVHVERARRGVLFGDTPPTIHKENILPLNDLLALTGGRKAEYLAGLG